MRVGFIHPFLFRYARGIERFTLNLANQLAARELDVELLTWRWGKKFRLKQTHPDITVQELPTSRYYAAKAIVPFYVWELARRQYDLVWIYFADYGEAAALNLLKRQRFGIVLHYPVEQVPHRYQEFQHAGLVERAAHVVAVSEYVARGAEATFQRRPTVIPHGVDAHRFCPNPQVRSAMRAKLEIDENEIVIVTAAALEERKGIQWVLRALPNVLPSQRLTYLVLGEGAYKSELEHIARAQNLDGAVRFLGAHSDIVPYYQAADLAVILARGEASSLFALEAFACELPVITSGAPPFEELIDEEIGLQVDETNASQVAHAIMQLGADSALRTMMGRRARERVLADFTWEKAADAYIKLMQTR
jgi:glycosyltransferase involved in cell wall biosynthesis